MTFLSSVITTLLSCEAFCLGGSPNWHCLSVTKLSLLPACYTPCVGHVLQSQGVIFGFLSVQLIFTPATTVAAVQSDIPVVSSSPSPSCQSAAAQVRLSVPVWCWRSGSQWRDGHCILQSALLCLSGEIHKTLRTSRACLFCRNDNLIKHRFRLLDVHSSRLMKVLLMTLYFQFYCIPDFFLM